MHNLSDVNACAALMKSHTTNPTAPGGTHWLKDNMVQWLRVEPGNRLSRFARELYH